jgi:putative ABC transport system permease protein
MDLLSTLRIAFRALARNKMRSILTMLGIIIGVGAVIAMVGIGQGADQTVQKQIANLGSNMLFVSSGSMNRGGLNLGWGATKTLVRADVAAIVKECPAVAAAAPGTQTSAQIVFENDNWGTRITGTTPEYFEIRTWPFQSGAGFTEDDVTNSANVAVIGETVRKNLFPMTDPIGKTVRIGYLPFIVVGVLVA